MSTQRIKAAPKNDGHDAERIAKAIAKRERKNAKRLRDLKVAP